MLHGPCLMVGAFLWRTAIATIQHSVISDADRHEAKGASTAVAGTACMANGDGTTTFRKVNYTDLGVKATSKGYALSLSSQSTSATQTPGASNTALQVLFGAAASNTDVAVSAAGAVTLTTAGQYAIRYDLNFAAGASGSIVFFRVLLNGSPYEPTHRVQLAANQISGWAETFFIDAAAGSVITFQIASDSAGASIGGLAQSAPNTSGWAVDPAAEVTIYKYQGVQ